MKTNSLQFKAGVKLRRSHFEPRPQQILSAALVTAPDTVDGRVVVTEAYREPRHPLDMHTLCAAFDFRIHNIIVPPGAARVEYESRKAVAWGWVNAMRDYLDDARFQFDVHGELANSHLHAEFDSRGA